MKTTNLAFFEDYLKGAAYSADGADGLALGAPAAIICLDDGDNVIYQDNGVAFAYFYAVSAAIAFFKVYIGHLCHL